MSGGNNAWAPNSLQLGRAWAGQLWPLEGQKPGNRRHVPQTEDRELEWAPAENYRVSPVPGSELTDALGKDLPTRAGDSTPRLPVHVFPPCPAGDFPMSRAPNKREGIGSLEREG